MEKPLQIPPGKKIKHLTVYCRHKECRTNVSDICKCNGKDINKCPHPEKHVFKSYVPVPGSSNERKTKQYESRDINEVIPQAIEFEKTVKENQFDNKIDVPTSKREQEKVETENIPISIAHVLARFIAYQANENVPSHLQKERSPEHIKDMEISVKLFAECLKKNKQDILKLSVYDLNDKIVGQFYDYLQIDKAYAGRTFNKRMGHLTSCIKWYNETFEVSIKNYFEKVPRKTVNYHPEIISKEEFDALLGKINHANGFIEYETGVKKIRNVYRPWLKDGLKLALETGRRREEVINLKYSDVVKDEKDNGYIVVEDYKVNRIQGRKLPEEKKYIYIPLTQSLNDLLENLKTKDYKETDFILAPNLKIKRNRIMSDVLSRGFSHYHNQLKTGRKLTFKTLRKTYITSLSLFMGGNAKSITQHSTDEVVEKHYLNKEAVAKAAVRFNVFEQSSRHNQLETVRSNSLGSKIEKKGIEK